MKIGGFWWRLKALRRPDPWVCSHCGEPMTDDTERGWTTCPDCGYPQLRMAR